MWWRRGQWHPLLMCSGNGPGWGFSGPHPPWKSEWQNRTQGLQELLRLEQALLTCFISRETQKLPKNEVAAAKQAAERTLELWYTVFCRQQCFSVKATSPRAGTAARRKPLSASTKQWSHGGAPASRGQECSGCRVWVQSTPGIRPHAGILMRNKEKMWRFYDNCICVLKIPSVSFRTFMSLQQEQIFLFIY